MTGASSNSSFLHGPGITGQDPFEAAAFGRHPSRSTSERAAEQSATKAIYFRKR
jgi:hypothetical protein